MEKMNSPEEVTPLTQPEEHEESVEGGLRDINSPLSNLNRAAMLATVAAGILVGGTEDADAASRKKTRTDSSPQAHQIEQIKAPESATQWAMNLLNKGKQTLKNAQEKGPGKNSVGEELNTFHNLFTTFVDKSENNIDGKVYGPEEIKALRDIHTEWLRLMPIAMKYIDAQIEFSKDQRAFHQGILDEIKAGRKKDGPAFDGDYPNGISKLNIEAVTLYGRNLHILAKYQATLTNGKVWLEKSLN